MAKKDLINACVKIATEQIGTKENPKGSNKNKYAQFFDDLRKKGIDFYNYCKNGCSWCDIFTDYVYCMAVLETRPDLSVNEGVTLGAKMIYQPMKSCGAGCKFSAEYYRENKAFYKTPEVGDQVFYGKDGKAGTESHTGIVVKVNAKSFVTVEGNAGDEVKQKTVQNSQIGKKIVGFGRPRWDIAVKADEPTAKPEPVEKPKEEKPAPVPAKPSEGNKVVKKVITSEIMPKNINKAYAKKWTVNTVVDPLALRTGPGSNFRRLARMPKGTVISSDGAYTGSWLYVTFEAKGIIYKGFCWLKYLK
jgi:hypothetical protein